MSTIFVEHIQASICAVTGARIDTLICEYPLAIHAQLLTHGALSKNSSSSRAIPIGSAISQIRKQPARPIFTAKKKGMQGDRITDRSHLSHIQLVHDLAMEQAFTTANWMDTNGVHKQNAGRYLHAFQNIRIVLTATEWENWDWLRIDSAAQPEIQELAIAIKAARDNAEPLKLNAGEYHVPFVDRCRNVAGQLEYFSSSKVMETKIIEVTQFDKISLKEAIDISMSCCAQTSYRKLDTSMGKAEDIIPKLFGGEKIHSSPAEHQATPIDEIYHGAPPVAGLQEIMASLPAGINAIGVDLQFRSGNFVNWIQQRQLIEGHDKALAYDPADGPAKACNQCDDEG